MYGLPEIDDYPEAMRNSVERLRRTLRRRRIVSGVLTGVSAISRIMLIGLGAWLIAQATDRDPPVDAKVMLPNPTVAPGGDLEVDVQLYRKRVCRAKATYMIFDGRDRLVSLIEGQWVDAAGNKGNDSFARGLRLPTESMPGIGRLRLERSYKCSNNVFHDRYPITVVDPDMSFKIEAVN